MPTYRGAPEPVSVPGLWVTVFTATLSAVLVGALVIGLSVRAYLHWSVRDTMNQMNEKPKSGAR